MSIKIIDTLEPLGRFPAANAKDVEVEVEGKRLDEVIEELKAGSGTGGTKNYNDLENQPKVNGVTLSGDKSTADLGINIPTKTSQLQNDSNFLTEHQSLEAYVKKSEVPNVPQWALNASKPTYTKAEVGLSDVDNTSDADKPVSYATQAALRTKADNADLEALSARMDEFTNLPSGSTAGDAELADIRIGTDGKMYTSAGAAVRNQISALNEATKDIKSGLKRTNLFNKSKAIRGYALSRTVGSQFAPIENAEYFYLDEKFPVKTGDIIRSTGTYNVYVFYDADDKVVGSMSTDANRTVSVPEVADNTYMRYYQKADYAHYEHFAFNINGYLPETDVDYDKCLVPESVKQLSEDTAKEYMIFANMFDVNAVLFDTEVIQNTPSCTFKQTAGKFAYGRLFNVKNGDTVYVANSWCGFLFYDENNEYLGRYALEGPKAFTVNFANAKKMRYYGNTSDNLTANQMISINRKLPDEYIKYGVHFASYEATAFGSLSEDVDKLNAGFERTNLFDKSKAVLGYSLSRTAGTQFAPIETEGYYYYPERIPVKTGDVIRSTATYNVYVLYDSNDVTIRAIDTGTDYEITIPEVPTNTYMRFYQKSDYAHYEHFAININGYLPETDIDYEKNFIPVAVKDSEKNNVKQYMEYTNMFNAADVLEGFEPITSAASCTFRAVENRFLYLNVFDVKYGDTINVRYSWCGFLFYDENNQYVGRYAPQGEKTFTVNFENARKARYYGNTSDNLVANQMIAINRKLPADFVPYGVKEVDRLAKEIEESETSNPCNFTGDDITAFSKIICIGDSLTEGAFNVDGDQGYRIYDKYSYPRSLERLTGVTVTNKGHGGLTSLEYWNTHKNDDFSGHDVAVIELGTNDYWRYGSSWTQSSIDGMTNIINKLKAENKGIFIFVTTIPQVQAYRDNRVLSPKIKSFVEGLNDDHVICLDITTYGHTDESVGYNAQHLSAYGYNRLARDIKSYISWYMNKNREVFRKIQFIGTDDTYTG